MNIWNLRRRAGRWAFLGGAVAAALSGLSGCAGFSEDGGFGTVAASAQSRLDKNVSWPRSAAEAAKSATFTRLYFSLPSTSMGLTHAV